VVRQRVTAPKASIPPQTISRMIRFSTGMAFYRV
jgi:hypothetical protein